MPLIYDDGTRPASVNAGRGRKRQSTRKRRAQVRHGKRLASWRAITGAKAYLNQSAGEPMTLREAAACHGANPVYVQQAVWLVKAGDKDLIQAVVCGDEALVPAAKQAWARVTANKALKILDPASKTAVFAATGFTDELSDLLITSTPAERTAAAYVLHPETTWRDMIEPLISSTE